jgi:hypothetical protein
MTDVLAEAKHRLATGLDCEPPIFEPLIADQWVIKSLLQKSIRRGEVDIARRAALTFLAQKGSAIWRRFIIIAFEDIGAGSVDDVAMTVAASTDASWRRKFGGDVIIVAHLARLLAEAPKSRSAEHLVTTATHHPSVEHERRLVSNRSIANNLAAVANESNTLTHRALAAWCVSGVGWKHQKLHGTDLPGLFDAYRNLGVPEELVAATGIAAAKSREPITLMVPLIWLAANDGQVPFALKAEVPWSPVLDGIPMYALDKHTRIGQESIRNLVKYNCEIRECLERYVVPAKWHAAAYMAAFYVDAAPLACRLIWQGCDELEALGTEADLLKVGVSSEGIQPLLRLFRRNVDQLNQIRADTICRKRPLNGVVPNLITDGEGRA